MFKTLCFAVLLLHLMQVIESLSYFGFHVVSLFWFFFMTLPLDLLWMDTTLSSHPLHFGVP